MIEELLINKMRHRNAMQTYIKYAKVSALLTKLSKWYNKHRIEVQTKTLLIMLNFRINFKFGKYISKKGSSLEKRNRSVIQNSFKFMSVAMITKENQAK